MLFSWCCRWFFPITSPAVQELDRKVTMAEQIATMRYRMNAFMFWFIIFFLPPAKFRFSSFRFLSEVFPFRFQESTFCETTRFEAWSLGFITLVFWKALSWENRGCCLVFLCFLVLLFRPFLFPQLGRFFSPTGQVILRAFWITMQRYEIPICQVCDSVRYHAIAEHFLKNYQLSTINYHYKLSTQVSQVLPPHALKGQKLLAQGIALGNYGRKPVAL